MPESGLTGDAPWERHDHRRAPIVEALATRNVAPYALERAGRGGPTAHRNREVSSAMERDAIMEERRLTAAIAAALLGQEGSPVWTRTAELLLLSSEETRRHFNRAKLELEDLLGDATPRR